MRAKSRNAIAAHIAKLPLPQAQPFAGFVQNGDAGEPVPCWGAIAERFEQDFETDEDRLAVWGALLSAGDARPLLLFLHVNRGKPAVLAGVVETTDRIPAVVQRALVSMPEAKGEVAVDRVHPAARQLLDTGSTASCRERELFEGRIAELLAFRYFVPDDVDPAQEGASDRLLLPPGRTDAQQPGGRP